MNVPFSLTRTKQCAGCPWRKAIDPNTIPCGFQPETWAKVAAAQPPPGQVPTTSTRVNMQCHDSPDHKPQHCIGWLENQLTVGNNVGVRLAMMGCQNITDIQTEGEQRQSFTEILTDALAMNPDLEKPARYECCDLCCGTGKVEDDDDDPPLAGKFMLTCPDCDGEGRILVDADDARDDATEARWEATRNK